MKRREFMGCVTVGGGAALAAAGCRNSKERDAEPENTPISQKEVGPRVSGSLDPRIDVSLDRIGWNLARVNEKVNVPVLAVIKAEAYGHGLVEVGRYLEARRVHGLMVGKLAEAHRLREAGIRCPVFNYGPFSAEDAAVVVESDIVQSIYTADVRRLQEAASKSGRPAAVNVHIDTGMNRAGVSVDKALDYLEMVAGLSTVKIRGVSTTFTEEPEFDKEQLRRFVGICSKARERGIEYGLRHAASSAGLFYESEYHLDMVRPGIALYGYYPNAATRSKDALSLKPALRLVGRITCLRDLKAGESLSYLRAIKAERPMRVATVGVGYSDGYPPGLGGHSSAIIRGRPYPLLSAVNSNQLMIDLKNDSSVALGDEVVLVDDRKGSGVAADALAELGGISDYKILIGLNPLLKRTYSDGG
jgi:alanine racemase